MTAKTYAGDAATGPVLITLGRDGLQKAHWRLNVPEPVIANGIAERDARLHCAIHYETGLIVVCRWEQPLRTGARNLAYKGSGKVTADTGTWIVPSQARAKTITDIGKLPDHLDVEHFEDQGFETVGLRQPDEGMDETDPEYPEYRFVTTRDLKQEQMFLLVPEGRYPALNQDSSPVTKLTTALGVE